MMINTYKSFKLFKINQKRFTMFAVVMLIAGMIMLGIPAKEATATGIHTKEASVTIVPNMLDNAVFSLAASAGDPKHYDFLPQHQESARALAGFELPVRGSGHIITTAPGTDFDHNYYPNLHAIDIGFAPGGNNQIYAPSGGVATCFPKSLNRKGFGNTIRIVHPNGYQTDLGHMSDTGFCTNLKNAYRDGQKTVGNVNKGDVIGIMGNTGGAVGTHVHWQFQSAQGDFTSIPLYGVVGLKFRDAPDANGIFPRTNALSCSSATWGGRFWPRVCDNYGVAEWEANSSGGATGQTRYIIKNVNSGKCLDVYSRSLDNGATITQWDCNGGTNQQWFFQLVGGTNSTYIIKNVNSGKCLDVYSWNRNNGATITQWDCNGGTNQQWSVVYGPVIQGTPFRNVNSSKCLDVYGWSRDNRATITQWDCHGGANQNWQRLQA